MEIVNAPWIGTVLGVIGISFAIYQIFRSRGPKISFQYIGQSIIKGESTDLPGGLKVIFEDRVLDNLSLTQLVFWNRGSSSVRRSDIVEDDPVRVSFGDGAKIVKVDVQKTTRAAIQFDTLVVVGEPDTVLIRFLFLDEQDGALLKIWHTGTETAPTFSGTIVGAPRGVEDLGRMPPRYPRKSVRARSSSDPLETAAIRTASILYGGPIAAPTIAMIMGLAGIMFILSSPSIGVTVSSTNWWAITAGAALYFFTGFIGFWAMRRRYPASIEPDELGAGKSRTTEEPNNSE